MVKIGHPLTVPTCQPLVPRLALPPLPELSLLLVDAGECCVDDGGVIFCIEVFFFQFNCPLVELLPVIVCGMDGVQKLIQE